MTNYRVSLQAKFQKNGLCRTVCNSKCKQWRNDHSLCKAS